MIELVVRLVFSLGIVLGLLALLTKFGAKKFRGNHRSAIHVMHRQHLSRGSTVSIVSVGSRVLVLGTTEHKISLLAELDPQEFPAAADATEEVTAPVAPLALVPAPAPALAAAPALAPASSATESVLGPAIAAAFAHTPTPATALVQPAVQPAVQLADQLALGTPIGASPSTVDAARTATRRSDTGFGGSILSAQTWKQAFAAATGKGQVAS